MAVWFEMTNTAEVKLEWIQESSVTGETKRNCLLIN